MGAEHLKCNIVLKLISPFAFHIFNEATKIFKLHTWLTFVVQSNFVLDSGMTTIFVVMWFKRKEKRLFFFQTQGRIRDLLNINMQTKM